MSRINDLIKTTKENPEPAFYRTPNRGITALYDMYHHACHINFSGDLIFNKNFHGIRKVDMTRFIEWLSYHYSEGHAISHPPTSPKDIIDEKVKIRKKPWWKFYE
jgi:hypothetical protein